MGLSCRCHMALRMGTRMRRQQSCCSSTAWQAKSAADQTAAWKKAATPVLYDAWRVTRRAEVMHRVSTALQLPQDREPSVHATGVRDAVVAHDAAVKAVDAYITNKNAGAVLDGRGKSLEQLIQLVAFDAASLKALLSGWSNDVPTGMSLWLCVWGVQAGSLLARGYSSHLSDISEHLSLSAIRRYM
jgi:hypothetical protein